MPKSTSHHMQRAKWSLIVALAATVIVLAASLAFGSNPIPIDQVFKRLFDPSLDQGAIVWGSRVPRTVLGVIVGACLGIAGTIMQGQTRNPLADPGLFGVSAGASLAVVIGVYLLHTSSTTVILLLALLGAIAASIVVFGIAAISRNLTSPVPLAIAGVAITSLCTALTSFVVLSDEDTLAAYRIWVVGSLSGRQLDNLWIVALFICGGLALAALNIRSLDAFALGSDMAKSLGESIGRARIVGLGAITLLTAAAVALTGPIGFIGLTAPHIARWMVGSKHAKLIPMSALVGVIVLLASDVIGRVIGGLSEVSVGVVLSVLGGCAFVWIVRRSRITAL